MIRTDVKMETLQIDSKFTKQYHDKTLAKHHSPIPSDKLIYLQTCSKTPPSKNLFDVESAKLILFVWFPNKFGSPNDFSYWRFKKTCRC